MLGLHPQLIKLLPRNKLVFVFDYPPPLFTLFERGRLNSFLSMGSSKDNICDARDDNKEKYHPEQDARPRKKAPDQAFVSKLVIHCRVSSPKLEVKDEKPDGIEDADDDCGNRADRCCALEVGMHAEDF
jgi:hypothetical protein